MMDTDTMVSVIIPMYNAQHTIERCLASVKSQTYKNWEIVVVNDGSTDNSVGVVERYSCSEGLRNFRLIDKENGGVSSARNAGLKVAEGDFIAFLDSDDSWFPEKLARQMSIMGANPNIDMLGGLWSKDGFGGLGKIRGNLDMTRILVTDLVFKNYFQPSTVLIKRQVVAKVGFFPESQRYAEEGNYFMRVADDFECWVKRELWIEYGNNKAGFGESGLSANLLEMEKGELWNLSYAVRHKLISRKIYFLAFGYSIIRFARRVVVVRLKKLLQ